MYKRRLKESLTLLLPQVLSRKPSNNPSMEQAFFVGSERAYIAEIVAATTWYAPPLLRTYTSHQKQKHRVCVSQCQSVSCSIAYAEGVSRSSLLCPDSSNCLQILPNPVDLHLEYSKCAPSSTGSASSSVYSVTAWVLQTVDIWAKWKLQTNPCNGEILLNARNPHLFTFVSVLWPVVYCGTPVPHISIKPSSFHHGWHAPTW